MTTPWHRVRPTGAVDVATDDDDFVTVDRWPSEVFRPHYHDAEFNWIVPLRAGRVVVSIDGEEFAIDGDHWLCVFPRAAHAVVHVSDDCEVLSLFIPDATMAARNGAQFVINELNKGSAPSPYEKVGFGGLKI